MSVGEASLVDPFDLPEWLVEEEVVWEALEPVGGQVVAKGQLRATATAHPPLRLNLLAVDAAWPQVACPPAERREAHQAWLFGQVVILDHDGTPALGVPATEFSADLAVEALRRFAKAVGSDPWRYAVHLRL